MHIDNLIHNNHHILNISEEDLNNLVEAEMLSFNVFKIVKNATQECGLKMLVERISRIEAEYVVPDEFVPNTVAYLCDKENMNHFGIQEVEESEIEFVRGSGVNVNGTMLGLTVVKVVLRVFIPDGIVFLGEAGQVVSVVVRNDNEE